MIKQEPIFGWHFTGDKLRDGSPIPDDGVWLPKIDNIKLCERGYHGSLQPFDALQYAPGGTLCYCEFRGKIIHGDDKLVAQDRRIIRRMEATELLRYFARMQAVSVVHLWDAPDVVLDFLMTGDDTLAASAASAASAARAASAAWDAARAASAAWDAASAASAAWDAARAATAARVASAAWDAASAARAAWVARAAWDAASAAWVAWVARAAWDAASAARVASAARDAARAARAARAAASADFNALVKECFDL